MSEVGRYRPGMDRDLIGARACLQRSDCPCVTEINQSWWSTTAGAPKAELTDERMKGRGRHIGADRRTVCADEKWTLIREKELSPFQIAEKRTFS